MTHAGVNYAIRPLDPQERQEWEGKRFHTDKEAEQWFGANVTLDRDGLPKDDTIYPMQEVANVKSRYLNRHPVCIYDKKGFLQSYAVETRIYPAKRVWDEIEWQWKWVRLGKNWFTNYIAFDIDVPNDVEEEEAVRRQEHSIQTLMSLLGQPMVKVKNKKHYTQEQLDRYWTQRDGTLKPPKRFGCQLVFLLDSSLHSDYHERVRVYKEIRDYLNSVSGADPLCHGHMMKNWFNNSLFDVEWYEEPSELNLQQLAVSLLGYEQSYVDKLWKVPKFLHEDEPMLSPLVEKAMEETVQWYEKLNTWKWDRKHKQRGGNRSGHGNSDWMRTSSRNVSLFNFLRYVPYEKLQDLTLDDVILEKPDLFDLCDHKERLGEEEFERTKNSVMFYRNGNSGSQPLDSHYLRYGMQKDKWYENVLPVDVLEYSEQGAAELLELLREWKQPREAYATFQHEALKGVNEVEVPFMTYFGDTEYDFLSKEYDCNMMVNCMLSCDPIKSLGTIRLWFNRNVMNFVWEEYMPLNTKRTLSNYKSWLKNVLYMTHFRTVHAIRQQRKKNREKAHKSLHVTPKSVRKDEKVQCICSRFGMTYVMQGRHGGKNAVKMATKMGKYVQKMVEAGHLKTEMTSIDGKRQLLVHFMPQSYYQSLFHKRNTEITYFVYILRLYFAMKALLSGDVYAKTGRSMLVVRFKHQVKPMTKKRYHVQKMCDFSEGLVYTMCHVTHLDELSLYGLCGPPFTSENLRLIKNFILLNRNGKIGIDGHVHVNRVSLKRINHHLDINYVSHTVCIFQIQSQEFI